MSRKLMALAISICGVTILIGSQREKRPTTGVKELRFYEFRASLDDLVFRHIRDLKIDRRGNAYVLAEDGSRVLQIRPAEGLFKIDFGLQKAFDVVTHRDLLYVSHHETQLAIYDAQGRFVREFSVPRHAEIVHVNSDGSLVLHPSADPRFLLTTIDSLGNKLFSLVEKVYAGPGGRPTFVADDDDNIYVFRENLPTFLKFNRQGQFLFEARLLLTDELKELLGKNPYFNNSEIAQDYLPFILDVQYRPGHGIYVLLNNQTLQVVGPDGSVQRTIDLRGNPNKPEPVIQFVVDSSGVMYFISKSFDAKVKQFRLER